MTRLLFLASLVLLPNLSIWGSATFQVIPEFELGAAETIQNEKLDESSPEPLLMKPSLTATRWVGAALWTTFAPPLFVPLFLDLDEGILVAFLCPALGWGQHIQGRYGSRNIAMFGELGGLGIMFAGGMLQWGGPSGEGGSKLLGGIGKTLLVAGGVIYVGSRVFEVADVWLGPALDIPFLEEGRVQFLPIVTEKLIGMNAHVQF